MDNMEKWALWGFTGGAEIGLILKRLDLGWYRSMAITCAVVYVNQYAIYRVCGGPDASK